MRLGSKRFWGFLLSLVMLLSLVLVVNRTAYATGGRTIYVGVIEYLNLDASGYQVHYWGGADGAKDASLTALDTTAQRSVGDQYWNGQAQKFDMYKAEIPADATSYKVHNGDTWFGGDGNVSNNAAFVFEYGGNYNTCYGSYTESAPTTATVIWKNGETILETDTDVEIGEAPSYDGAAPTKDLNDDYTYTFSGWNDGTNTYAPDALPNVSGDVTYTAVFTPVAKFTAGYYIVGNMNNWYPAPAYKLTLNTNANGTEYMLSRLSLTTASQFKVVYAEPNNWTWYPNNGGDYGENGEIQSDGKYTVYFRPGYDGGDEWFYRCISIQGDASASIQFLGAGIQRRVVNGTTDVVDYATNIRFGFTFQLPYGAEIDTNASYFRWKLGGQATATDGNKIDIKKLDTSGSDPVAHMIIAAVPKEYYTSDISCFIHLEYILNNTSYVLESGENGAYVRSVSYVCEGLIAAAGTPQLWKEYAQLLLDALN